MTGFDLKITFFFFFKWDLICPEYDCIGFKQVWSSPAYDWIWFICPWTVPNMTEFILNMTGFFLYVTVFFLNMTGV